MIHFLDFPLAIFILFIVFSARFNKWPQGAKHPKTGRPSEYCSPIRYRFYCCVYITTFLFVSVALFNLPEVMTVFPLTKEYAEIILKHRYLTVTSLITIVLFANPIVAVYEEHWRQQLHEWAEIPWAVTSMIQKISLPERFLLNEKMVERIKGELRVIFSGRSSEDSAKVWFGKIDQFLEETDKRSVHWLYMRCLAFYHITMERCTHLPIADLDQRHNRLVELGKLILLSKPHELEREADELRDMSVYFIENISKYIVKKYRTPEEQYYALINLGFNPNRTDCRPIEVKDAVVSCMLLVAVVSFTSVYFILDVIDARRPDDYLNPERFFQWGVGSWVCFTAAIFIGFLANNAPPVHKRFGAYQYMLLFMLTTLVTLIYFQVVHELSEQSRNLPYARFVLAMSFAALSIFVVKALKAVNHNRNGVLLVAFGHGLLFGVMMAGLQPLISAAFRWEDTSAHDSIVAAFMAQDYKLVLMSTIGFCKGATVAFGVSYILQEAQRKQRLVALRESPRVESGLILKLKTEEEEFPINLCNLSVKGAKISGHRQLAVGEAVVMAAPEIGVVNGVVTWCRKKWWGPQEAGIAFLEASDSTASYIRGTFGEYYA